MKAINLIPNRDVESKSSLINDFCVTNITSVPDDALNGKRINKLRLAMKNKWFLSFASFLMTFSILFSICFLLIQKSTADFEGSELQMSSRYLTPTSAGNEVISFDGNGGGIVDLATSLSSVQGNNPRSFSFMIQTTASNSLNAIISTGISGKYINDGLWHTVLVTFDGTTLNIYVDGKLDNTSVNWNDNLSPTEKHNANKRIIQSTDSMASTLNTVGNAGNYLGQWVENNGMRWSGKLKNVMFFDYALTISYALANNYQASGTVLYTTGNDVITFDGTHNTVVDLRYTLQCVQGNNPRSIYFMIRTTSDAKSCSGCAGFSILSTGSINVYGTFGIAYSFHEGYGVTPGIVQVDIGGNGYYPTTGTIINDGVWHTVLVTYDGTTLSFYVDGILNSYSTVWNSNTPHVIASNLNTVGNTGNYLGGWSDGSSFKWIGQLKDVTFYDYVVTNYSPVNLSMVPSMYPTIAPTAGVVTDSKYLTIKEAKYFKEELIKSVTNEAKKIIKMLEDEFESFKDKQEKITKILKEELKNLKEK